MKKLISMMLMLASVFFIACDDNEDKEPLTADEAKAELTQATSDMSAKMAMMMEAEGIEVMSVLNLLPDPFSTPAKSGVRTSVLPNIENYLLPLNPKDQAKSTFEAEQFNFEFWWGVFTWNNTEQKWDFVPDDPNITSDDMIVIHFPADDTNMADNNATITIYDYAEVLITEYDENIMDYYSYYNPTKILADLYVDEIKLFEINMSATWKEDGDGAGEPTELDISVYLFPFTFTGEINQTTSTADVDFSINYENATILGVGLDATFTAESEDFATVGGYIEFMKVKVIAEVDVAGLEAIFKAIDEGTSTLTPDELLAAINAEIDAEVLVDGAHAADIEIAINYNIVNEDDLPIVINFVYADGSSENAMPYFESLVSQIDAFMDYLEMIY